MGPLPSQRSVASAVDLEHLSNSAMSAADNSKRSIFLVLRVAPVRNKPSTAANIRGDGKSMRTCLGRFRHASYASSQTFMPLSISTWICRAANRIFCSEREASLHKRTILGGFSEFWADPFWSAMSADAAKKTPSGPPKVLTAYRVNL